MDFDAFVRGRSYGFASPVHRWNTMLNHWLGELPPDYTFIVRHEDQLADQIQTLARLQEALGLTRKSSTWTIFNDRVDVDMKRHGPMNTHTYLDRQYLRMFDQPLLEFVNDALDWGMMERFRYVRQDSTVKGVATAGPFDGRGPTTCITDASTRPVRADLAQQLIEQTWIYRRIGYDERPMEFLPNGKIGQGKSEAGDRLGNANESVGDLARYSFCGCSHMPPAMV